MPRNLRLIESDQFPFEFLSVLAERESWRKEIHRPIYHVHKWWAKRLGSVFRGILLGCRLDTSVDFPEEFYATHGSSSEVIFDPFMGSGTTVGEAHKLGMTALGRDINPVAFKATMTGLGKLDEKALKQSFAELQSDVGSRLRDLYKSTDRHGNACDVLYYFWVMQADCPECSRVVDLFSTYVFAKNARPKLKPEVQCYCPNCGEVFQSLYGKTSETCSHCSHHFDPTCGPATGMTASCGHCNSSFKIRNAANATRRPSFRLYAKLILRRDGRKEYLRATDADLLSYEGCKRQLDNSLVDGEIVLPSLALTNGHNTRQAMGYGFSSWRDFFNDRQLLALCWLKRSISEIPDADTKQAFETLFSGVLEFNNLFASYKGEGTGAVRHMFSHHILKPERMPIEANVWGTPKSSGSFSNLFPMRLLRAAAYQKCPTEVNGRSGDPRLCSLPLTGRIEAGWPSSRVLKSRAIYLSCGDSSTTGLPNECVDFVVTDPPFFDNVHYSELADFFHAWQVEMSNGAGENCTSTRSQLEVQDKDVDKFAAKLSSVFQECHRVLKKDGLLVFSYHHSRNDGWTSLASAIIGSGFIVKNSQPIKAEMSVATPKSQAKEPIQFDIVLVCGKREDCGKELASNPADSLVVARSKAERLIQAGFKLSQNDWRIIQYGQLLTRLRHLADIDAFYSNLDEVDISMEGLGKRNGGAAQPLLF